MNVTVNTSDWHTAAEPVMPPELLVVLVVAFAFLHIHVRYR